MKQLQSVENEQVSLEVIECDCGFHLGIDATWLEQCDSDNVEMECPNCHLMIPVDKLTKPIEHNGTTCSILESMGVKPPSNK